MSQGNSGLSLLRSNIGQGFAQAKHAAFGLNTHRAMNPGALLWAGMNRPSVYTFAMFDCIIAKRLEKVFVLNSRVF